MAEIFTEENSIILAAAQKMIALGATIGDRQADGKESLEEYEQGMKILNLLTAYKDHSFTNPQLEAILYDLRNLSEENNFPTISPVVGQEIVYLVEQESGSGTGTISFESNGSGLTDRDTLNFYNGLSASDGGTKINAGLGGPLALNTTITLGSFNLTFAGGGSGKLGIDLGSDATGDMLYRDASGDIARLGITNDRLVGGVSGVPAYVSVSAPLTLGAGVLAITQATTSTSGYLSSTDWNTFNNKAAPLGFTPINKAGDTGISGNLSFNTGTGIDSPGVLSIGPNATQTNLYGTELFVQDKLMTLNALGGIASGGGAGFEINENSVINGWFKTTTARTGYSIKGPANTAETNFILSSTVSRDITFPDQAGTVVLTSGATMTGYLTLHADPSSALHPATKQYVDNLLDGLKWKQSVVVATTANITLSGEQTIDGVLTSASRILVKDQTDQTENGIYVTAAGAWSRSSDANTATELEAATVHVQQGTVGANKDFVQVTDGITLGVSNIIWTEKSSSSKLSAIQAADATNTINNADYAQEWQWNSLSSNTGLLLSSSSTAAASNTQTVFRVNQTGANATSSQTTYAGYLSNTKTGTSAKNVALHLAASGGTTNYALEINSGSLFVGAGSNTMVFSPGVGGNPFTITNPFGSTSFGITNTFQRKFYNSSANGGFIGINYFLSSAGSTDDTSAPYIGRTGSSGAGDVVMPQSGLVIGNTTITTNALLDLQSTTKALRLTNVTNDAAIATKAEGMIWHSAATDYLVHHGLGLQLGDADYAGASRSVTASGSASNISLDLVPKGTSPVQVGSRYFQMGRTTDGDTFRTITSEGTETNITLDIYSKGTLGWVDVNGTFQVYDLNHPTGERASFNVINYAGLQILEGNSFFKFKSIPASGTAADLVIQAGYDTGKSNLYLDVETGGADEGNIGFLTTSVSDWQDMDRGFFEGNVQTSPTDNPVNGIFRWVSSEPEGSNLKIRTTGGHFAKPILQAKVTVAGGATLRGIGTAQQTIIAAPGANKYLNIVSVACSYNGATAAYDFTGSITFEFSGGTGSVGWAAPNSFLNTTTDSNFQVFQAAISSISQPSNTAFVIGTSDDANATTGDGDLDIVVYYTVEDANT